jgi:hypothetical protein
MGQLFYIACTECKITRDLDKFYTLFHCLEQKIKDKNEMIEFSEHVEKDSFRSALLISFMAEHYGHKCVLTNEQDSVYSPGAVIENCSHPPPGEIGHDYRIYNEAIAGDCKEDIYYWEDVTSDEHE